MKPFPWMTPECEGLPFLIRRELEDFEVHEVPLYEASGEGGHLFVTIEKRGLDTSRAKRVLAKHFGVDPRTIGHAGQKDAAAVARQRLSLEGVSVEDALAFEHNRVKILDAIPHGHKLRRGHLAGNYFSILLRDLPEGSLPRVQQVLDLLEQRGLPNRYMAQRFGIRGDNAALGRMLVLGDTAGAREGARGQGHRHWPKALRTLMVGAWQAQIFNSVLQERMGWPGGLQAVTPGDLAIRHESGGIFLVEDAEDSKRSEAKEISASAPLPGRKARLPEGAPLELEQRVLAEDGVSQADLERSDPLLSRLGARRPMRALLSRVSLAERAEGLLVGFQLPPGSFATAVIDEIGKGLGVGWGLSSCDGPAEVQKDPSSGR